MGDSRVKTATAEQAGAKITADQQKAINALASLATGDEDDDDDEEDDDDSDDEDDDDDHDDDEDDEDDDEDEDDEDEDDDRKKRKRRSSKSAKSEYDEDAVVDRLAKVVESAVDRRINAILKDQRRDSGGTSRRGGTQKQRNEDTVAKDERERDVRETRLAFREYVGDGFKFATTEEKELAMDLGKTLIVSRAAAEGVTDPDALGREVAKSVHETIKANRKAYERKFRANLRRAGVTLPERDAGTQGAGRATSRSSSVVGKSPEAQFTRGQARAAARHPQPGQSTGQ